MKLSRGMGLLLIFLFVLFLLFKLGLIALGGWLVYTGIVDVTLDAFTGWTFFRFLAGAIALYIGLTAKLSFNFNK